LGRARKAGGLREQACVVREENRPTKKVNHALEDMSAPIDSWELKSVGTIACGFVEGLEEKVLSIVDLAKKDMISQAGWTKNSVSKN